MPQKVRVELYPPGTTNERRGTVIASAVIPAADTGQSDPGALPTVASLVQGGFSGSPVALVTPLEGGFTVYCAVGKAPDATKEPRQILRQGTTAIEIGAADRIAFSLVA